MRLVVLLVMAGSLSAQTFTQRGFLDNRATLFPQEAPGDSGRAVGEWLLRYEPAWKVLPWLKLQGSFDARTDTHRQVDRVFKLDWRDRGPRRPAFGVRRLSATIHEGKWTIELGKQFIRWGKADILNPTDRFAPRDFMNVVDNDFLAVTGGRVTWESGGNTIDAVCVPFFTPSRTPLINQRWVVLPPGVPVANGVTRYPGGSQQGIRWNRLGAGYEFSLSFFDGFNHLPLLDVTINSSLSRVDLSRRYARIRTYGADAAMPLRWFTVKGEVAYFTSPTPGADEYFQYVVEMEHIKGEWSFVGGYAGEYVTNKRTTLDFAPDRGIARAFIGRAGYTIDATRSVSLEAALRQNGAGAWSRAEYSQMFGGHWRGTVGASWIRGNQDDFLGQYRRNSNVTLSMRYSF